MVRTMREQARRSRAGARLPSSPGAPSDPAAATGSPWPRLTAAPGAGTARRLRRWVIVAGIVLLAGSITATVTGRTLSPPAPRPAAGYLLAAHDAHFTALFPRKPLRIEKTAGTTTIIVYLADLPGYAVGIICAPVPASGLVKLDRAINVAASALPGGDVVPATGSPTTDSPPKTPPYPSWESPDRSASWYSAHQPTSSKDSGPPPPASPTTTRSCSTRLPHIHPAAQQAKTPQPQRHSRGRKDHDRQCDPDPANAPAMGRPGQPAAAAPAAAPRQLSRLAGHRIGQYAHLQQC